MHPAAATHCRLTVVAPRARVDVALPADLPVAELVPMVLELVGEPRPGTRPEPWRLSGAAGGPLPSAATLDELGVLDGELLRIAPDTPPPAAPVFDDPVDAVATTVGGGGAVGRRFAAGAVLVVAVAAGALLSVTPGVTGVLAGALTAVVAVGYAAHLVRLAGLPDPAAGRDPEALRLAAATAGLAAVPVAAAAGWTALAGSPAAAQLLLATAAAAVTATAAQFALRVVAPALVGIVVAAVPVALSAITVLRFGVATEAAAAGMVALTLAVAPLLPRAALRLAGLPRPVVPADGAELTDADGDPMPPDELAERADLARGYLAGLVAGCAAVASAATLPAAASGGWSGPALAAVTVAVLGLRARGFADAGPARALLVSAIVAAVGLAAVAAVRAPDARVAVAAGLFAAAACGAAAIGRGRPAGSPVARRAVALLDAVLVAATIPLALAVMNAYALVRGL